MTVTEAYRCKRALFDSLTALTAPGLSLAGLQVAYAWPGGTAERECVYGGVRFTRANAGQDDRGVLWLETTTIGLYVRVGIPGAEVAETDARCEAIGTAIETSLAAQPDLGGGFTYTGMSGGTGDYAADDEGPTSVLAYQVQCQYYLD
jgi:hypothetical protein